MSELKLEQLSLKSQKSRFAPVIFAEANALSKKRPEESLAALDAHARDRVAFGEYSQRLRKEADIDALTGLLSRRAILREIQTAMYKAERKGESIQVVFADVRDFKTINDKYSHGTGDHALRLIATGLKGHTRGYDTIGRYGGDEDIVLLPDSDQHVADFLRKRLHLVLDKENSPYNSMKIDFGVADYNPTRDGKLTVDELVHRADQAMYFAKEHRLERAARWDQSMASIVVKK